MKKNNLYLDLDFELQDGQHLIKAYLKYIL